MLIHSYEAVFHTCPRQILACFCHVHPYLGHLPILEKEVIPLFFDRGPDGLPHKWIEMMKNSIIMEGVVVGEGSQVQNAIIDKEVNIPSHTQIGYDPKQDAKRFVLTTSGIVIVAKKASVSG